MAEPNVRKLSIWPPSSVMATGAPETVTLEIAADKAERRAIVRTLRDANANDPGRIRRVPYDVWGPIGASMESEAGRLGIDWTRNLDTRWSSRLISTGKQNAVTLTGDDPPAATSGYFGGFTFGTNTFGNLTAPFTPSITGGDVVVMAEMQGYLIVFRERLVTQVDLSDWSVIETQILGANTRDADFWRGNVYAALGSSVAMQRLVGASPTGMVFEDTTSTTPSGDVYASAIKRGSDRAWYIDADTGSMFNYAGFTLDAFVNLASPFQVGDPLVGTTGIMPFGPITMFGAEDNIYSFTDQGKPVPFSRALLGFHSTQNGKQGADPGWGWNYVITAIGLRAITPGVDNPVGIGERMRGFTGHNGVPTAVWANRGELWVVYQDTAGDLYGYRGTFGPQTAGTGQPLMFPWFYQAATDCGAVFSSNTTANPVIIRAAGTNLVYTTINAEGRDDLDSEYLYDVAGGTAWLTTLDRDPQLLKTFRLARLRTRAMYPGDTWTVACAFDSKPNDPVNATYVQIGQATEDGFHTLTPTAGAVDTYGNPTPTSGISGRTIKPRITQVASATITNYCSNPSFEDGTTNWIFGSGGGAASSTVAQYGTYSCLINGGVGLTMEAQNAITLVASTTYTMKIGVYISTGVGVPSTCTVGVTGFTGATGNLTATPNLALTNQWQTVEVGPFTTASDVTGVISAGGSGTGGFYIDGVMVVNSATQIDYFDGNSGAGYAWNGTAERSTSTWTPGVTTPPEVNAFEIEYDERPAQIEEVIVSVKMPAVGWTNNMLWQLFHDLTGSSTDGPFKIQLPDDQTPGVTGSSGGGQKYAMLSAVTGRKDMDGETEMVDLRLTVWPEAEPLS